MERIRVSLCIIARNEADNIARCIKSVAKLADEIIVVDTGSKDGTQEIAESWGAKVISAEWEDDFSKARNISLENASGEWILFLDCDEEIHPDSLPELERLVEQEGAEAYFLQIVNTTEQEMELIVPGLRLFRNRKEYRFTGRIHEQIMPAIIKHSNQNHILHSNVVVIHYGYNDSKANIPAKIHRNMKILQNTPEENRDGFYYYNLGTEYLRLGQKEEALNTFLQAAPLTHPGQGYGPIMIKRIITLLFELGKYRQALLYLEHYRGIYQDFNDLVLLTGVCHFMCGRYTKAKNILRKYLELPPAPQWYPIEKAFLSQTPEELLNMAVSHAVSKDHPLLSVCILGKNEQATLATCIKSVNEIAHQVVYVDTGSSDRSRETAFELGAEVHSIPWPNNYSAAINYGLEQCTGEWMLVLNADEVFPETSVEPVAQAIKSKVLSAYKAKIITYLDAYQSLNNCQITGSIRLFRRPGRYRGALAQDLEINGESCEAEPLKDMEIIHLHYQASSWLSEEKSKSFLNVVAAVWADESPSKQFYIGREMFYTKNIQGTIEKLEYAVNSGIKELSTAYYYLIMSLINTGQFRLAINLAEEAHKAFPDYTDLLYMKAVAHGMTGQVKEAEDLLLQCLHQGEAAWWNYLVSPGVGTFKALISLGTIYVKHGRFLEAINIFIQAAGLPPSSRQAIENLVALQSAAGLPIDVLLKNNGLYNWQNMLIAAQAMVKSGFRTAVWENIEMIDNLTKSEQQEMLLGIVGILDMLMLQTRNHMLQLMPDHPLLDLVK
ncbi:MAG: glycosyltransferase [Syntrophomonas sp.]